MKPLPVPRPYARTTAEPRKEGPNRRHNPYPPCRLFAGWMAGHTGQLVMREIVEDYLRYVIRADDGYPRALQLRHCEPSKVIMDPYRAFGQPIFEGSRARVADVAGMLSAGEDPQVVADEHGVSIDDVRTAARVLLGHAA
jgi:uncharacterized protein (DUF433 family)